MVVYRKDDINKVNAIPLEMAVKNKDLWDRLEKIEDEGIREYYESPPIFLGVKK